MGLLDIFIERDEKPKDKPKQDKPASRPVVQPINVQSSAISPIQSYTATSSTTLGPEHAEFRQQFSRILEDENKRNFPGNDYYEFVVMKNAMNAIPDERLRYGAAFAGWAVGGNQSKQTLLDTAKIYLGLVEKEISDFEAAYKQQYEQQVTKNEQTIAQKEKEIQALMEKMSALNTEIQTLKEQNLSNTSHLSSKHDAFMTAGNMQKQEIQDEIDKINNYIN